MIRAFAGLMVAIIAAFPASGVQPPPFPDGTSQFFEKRAAAAVPATGEGVWVALPEGIVRYTATGSGTVLPTAGGGPYRLARGADGSLWFANGTGVGRTSTTGTVLQFHAIAQVRDIAVASDGALWYAQGAGPSIGRIAGNTVVTFTSPADVWSLAPASDGGVWILGTGFGTSTDVVFRMLPTGTVNALELGADVLYGTLQTVADGTLYVGTGYRNELLRVRTGSSTVERIPQVRDSMFLVDNAHNVWSATYSVLNYLSANGVFRFAVELPYDPRITTCTSVPVWAYRPLALDSAGGLWLRVFDDAVYLSLPPPCSLPNPPEMPTLIRIDTTALIAAHATEIPAMSTAWLVALAAMAALMGVLRLRG